MLTELRHISSIQIPDFPVAVERVAHAHLRTRPLIVAPVQSPRSSVFAVSALTGNIRCILTHREAPGWRVKIRLCIPVFES